MPDAELSARIRKFIFDAFLERSTPPVLEEVVREFSLSRDQAGLALTELEAARHIALVKGTGRILMAFPFSALATPFRVSVGERTYFANCAWDAIAFHVMLQQDVRVDSFCHHCAEPIALDLRDGRSVSVEPAQTIVYLALPPSRWWDDITTTCSNTMVFFASPEHRDASPLCTLPEASASLTPDQTIALSGPIYATKMQLGYARPAREALLAHFTAIGLTDPYWTS